MGPQEWIDKLKPMVSRDFALKEVLNERGTLNDIYHPEWEKIHIENADKLMRLIDKQGFPVLSNASGEGVQLAWLIIYHAVSRPSFMRECLIQMRLAAAQKDFPIELLAYVEDKVAYLEGRKQLYGTHFEWLNGELKPTPIEDVQQVDIRRKAIGLPSLSESLRSLPLERPPSDPPRRLREFELWRTRVGWHLPVS